MAATNRSRICCARTAIAWSPARRSSIAASLRGIGVLVISNAGQGAIASAFTDAECDAVRDWVRDGGSLLLIADHTPFGKAAAVLSARFGVKMGEGYVFEAPIGTPGGEIAFSTAASSLAGHPIVSGRDASETVRTVASFTGQSLDGPADSVSLLRLGATSREAPDLDAMRREARRCATAAPSARTPPPWRADRKGW